MKATLAVILATLAFIFLSPVQTAPLPIRRPTHNTENYNDDRGFLQSRQYEDFDTFRGKQWDLKSNITGPGHYDWVVSLPYRLIHRRGVTGEGAGEGEGEGWYGDPGYIPPSIMGVGKYTPIDGDGPISIPDLDSARYGGRTKNYDGPHSPGRLNPSADDYPQTTLYGKVQRGQAPPSALLPSSY
ncbi:hypothetical protein EV356DRAFT_519092 [Viridothelium virens]|uniref:Secreted protein n=1 Tax=Viridothelium virens TaxID=1048519 RepID=A0A6A6H0M2_VIRVR|nr:hypothetical protein EV356DRAFT_519092 [Viridothelium virens]